MNALQNFVDRENKFAGIFGSRILDLNNAQDRQRLADRIDCMLSPENLTCDGELTRGQVQAKFKELSTVANQLKKLDPTVKFYDFA